MAEDELDGFENLDDLFGEGEGGGDEAADVTDGIDDLLGDADGESSDGAGDEGGGEGTSDSELDSFFEDLSTIDDLEMTQEEAPAEEEEAVAAPVAAAEPAAAEKPARPDKKKKKGGFFGKLIKAAIVLLILGGGGYGVYYYFFPSEEVPWEVADVEEFVEEVVVERPEPLPPAPAPPPPEPEPVRPAPPPPPVEREGDYGIQVATCFFSSCVSEFRKWLRNQNLSSVVSERSRSRQMLEVFTKTIFDDRDRAQAIVERINREHRLEGQAYVRRESGQFRISMGNFTDLARATDVKDALNQRLKGDALFTTEIRNFPYKLKLIVAGNFTSRRAAQAARNKLVKADGRFGDSFVVSK